jgi:hypothetical protein
MSVSACKQVTSEHLPEQIRIKNIG